MKNYQALLTSFSGKYLNMLLLLLSLHLSQTTVAQEFETYANGLIYSEPTMTKLARIVDSLNLKYKTCDINKVFYSNKQTIGYIVRLDTDDIKAARSYMDQNLSLETFTADFPRAKIEKNVLIVKFNSDNEQEPTVEYCEVNLNSGYGLEIVSSNKDADARGGKNSWLYDYSEKSTYSKESIRAFYFPSGFTSIPLKLDYSRQVGYSDCLIDTSTTKFLNKAKEGDASLPRNWQKMSLKQKEKLLKKMRSTHVVGFCSMDSRPRIQAAHIALLSAETANWEVFLKSHLDIMNDRFDRRSDGSYAYAARKTYIKELEELNINVPDLVVGICLRVENPANNHYYGSINRLGRAISESTQRQNFESTMLAMIADKSLDDYNRIIVYFLFENYAHYLEETERKTSIEKLRTAIKSLPDYLYEKIKLSDK